MEEQILATLPLYRKGSQLLLRHKVVFFKKYLLHTYTCMLICKYLFCIFKNTCVFVYDYAYEYRCP